MSGMHGVSGSGSMPRNCGMEGMHGSASKKQSEQIQGNAEEQQVHNSKVHNIPDPFRGKAIDVKV